MYDAGIYFQEAVKKSHLFLGNRFSEMVWIPERIAPKKDALLYHYISATQYIQNVKLTLNQH